MSLRTKILFMLSTFLLIILIFSAGTLYVFDRMSGNISRLSSVSENLRQIRNLQGNISSFMRVTSNWAYTGDHRFRKLYHQRLAETYKSFGEVHAVIEKKADLESIGRDFRELIQYSKEIIEKDRPVGDPFVMNYMQQMDNKGKDVLAKVNELYDDSMITVVNVAQYGNMVGKNMSTFLLILIGGSFSLSLIFVIIIRGTIAGPVGELVKATEKISRGELSYRIGSRRRDELGVVAERFDSMVSALELSDIQIKRRLTETELLLDVARIAGSTVDPKDTLQLMADTITSHLGHESCAIYVYREDLKGYSREASTGSPETSPGRFLKQQDSAVQSLAVNLTPLILEDTGPPDVEYAALIGGLKSAAAVPIIRGNTCSGILMLGNSVPRRFSEDEVSILRILAHTIGSAARNAELYISMKRQLQKLTVLYELSRAVTSVLDLEELLHRIAREITRLLSSRGCIIRLIEENRLTIKSCYGLPEGVEQDMELKIGDGIAGWVAKNGAPLLVEDVQSMPEDMRVPIIDIKTAICVPLKAGEEIIGTLGLYDKHDDGGNILHFTIDDLNTAEGFAHISSIAIEKSKIFENEVIRQKKASEDKKRLDILFDSVQGGIVTLDRDYNVILANRYVEEWISAPEKDIVGRNCMDIFHDKVGICPHCAAKATFETGDINSIMQSRGVNYAELTAYPIKNEAGEITECVVFIMDITERVLYQEETLSLYREVIQTKEYLESIIDNSADAIVASDTKGLITSWNQGAEKIYGFTESEAVGKFLPFLPESLIEKEKDNMVRIKNGEVLKNIETIRRKGSGEIIEVSLTLSPIKDAAGEVIGVSGISRDISEKKRVENELIRRNQELSRLFFISSAMRSTLELDKLLRMILTAVTMSDGMGFNRAMLLLVEEEERVLRGAMGVGPASPEEAWKIWDEALLRPKGLDDIMQEIAANPINKDSFFDRLTAGLTIPLDEDTVLTRAVKEQRSFNVTDVNMEPLSDSVLIQQLGTRAYAVVPLISRDKTIGLIWVDNYFNRKAILDEDMKFLGSFSNHMASAIESTRLFEKVTMAEQQLENIFESMSDMVYFNSRDYVIKSINRAVSEKIGLPPERIIGRKCYEVFHGTDEPFVKCPHHKTVNTKQAYIEELDDPHMGGTFLTSSSPIFDLTGEFIGSVHVVRDITELSRLKKKLVMSEKMAALGEVAAKVAHEIRNPLVSIGGFAKRLEKKLDGNLKEYASIVVREVERLEQILREILGFVKEVRLSREVLNLGALMEETVEVMRSDSEDRGISIEKDIAGELYVVVDPNRVKEAILNILANAIQSIQGAGAIRVRTYGKENYAIVEIEDSGKGIPESDRQYIFDPFFTTKTSGTGLGLAITNRIIQEHNGRIEIESELERGSIFRIFIPLKEEDEE